MFPMSGNSTSSVEDLEKMVKFIKSMEGEKKKEEKKPEGWSTKEWYLILWLFFPITFVAYGLIWVYTALVFLKAVQSLPH